MTDAALMPPADSHDRAEAHAVRSNGGRRRRRTAVIIVSAAALVVGSACSASTNTSGNARGSVGGSGGALNPAGGPVVPGWDCATECVWTSADEDRVAIENVVLRGSRETTGVGRPTTDVAGPSDGRATSVDDNDSFAAYLEYRRAFEQSGFPFIAIPVDGRQIITVTDATGRPVAGARIAIVDPVGTSVASLLTYADGRAVFNPPAAVAPASPTRYAATITKAGASATTSLAADGTAIAVTLPIDAPPAVAARPKLEIMFVLDATGSMRDELARLQDQAAAMAARLAALPSEPELRLGLTVYRDRGELYESRTFSLTSDPAEFIAAVHEVRASGGGDTLEDLQSALSATVNRAGWTEADAVKIIVVVSDSAPHLYAEQALGSYAASAVSAASMGIKIFPIGAHGLDASGEYIFRQLAQATLGRYVYQAAGAGGPGSGPQTRSNDATAFGELALDELIVALVSGELQGSGR